MTDYSETIMNILGKGRKKTYLENLKNQFDQYKYLCIFGAGNIGQGTAKALIEKGITVSFFCDNDEQKIHQSFCGISCISLSELVEQKQNTIVIIATRYYKEIFKQLISYGIQNIVRIFSNKFEVDEYFAVTSLAEIRGKCAQLLSVLSDNESKRIVKRLIEEWFTDTYSYGQLDDIYTGNQYFPKDILSLSEQEIFLDGGAYTGDTLKDFLDNSHNKFDKVYLFELNKKIYETLCENINHLDKILSYKIVVSDYGLSNIEQEVLYQDLDEGSNICSTGSCVGKVTSIDKFLSGEKVTYIKMDIEGAEIDALTGAKETILRYKPKLAICIYHRPEHLWEIPLLINEICPGYKIYIRHHTDLLNETVCYAIP